MVNDSSIYGTDIDSSFSIGANGDLQLVSGVNNAEQAIKNRLLTQLDELEQFGYIDYGNQSIILIGSTDAPLAEAEAVIYIKNCLLKEPRVAGITDITATYNDNILQCGAKVSLIDGLNNLNLVFNIGG